jgi:uncharacterized membrane protein SirB2
MPYELYKLLHVAGLILLFLSLGGMSLHTLNGGTKDNNTSRKLLAITHGVALLLMLVAGFGLLARLGFATAWPLWVWPKLAIWLALGAASAFVYRKPALARILWFLLPLIGIIGAAVAIYKPGNTPAAPAPAAAPANP